MKKSYIKIMCGALLTFGLTACSTDLLDNPQHGVLNQENYYKSDQDAMEATTAIYGEITNASSLYNLETLRGLVNNLLADDTWPGEDTHGGGSWAISEFTFDSNSDFIKMYFKKLYNIVGKCNLVLDNVKGDTPVQQQMLAEARVIRAWMYMDLAAYWGNPPIVDHMLDASEAAQPNSDPAEVWKFIENDLETAINSGALTQKTDINDKNIYRVSKQFAQALLGKAYLWSKNYAESAKTYDEVINSHLFRLFDGDYQELLQPKNKSNAEFLFESNYIEDPNNPSACMNLYPMFLCNMRTNVWDQGANTSSLSYGFGMFVPRGTLYQAFVNEEGADGYRLNQTMKTYQQMNAMGYKLRDGVRVPTEGFIMWKNRLTYDWITKSSMYGTTNNTHWMRYAEVLLCAAEANLLSGNQQKADQYLNEVRQRAKLPFKTATMDAIKLEKRLELCGEGVRFNDLLRWGDAAKVLKDQGKIFPWMTADGKVTWDSSNTQYGFKEGRNERLPYPATEIVNNPNLKQNPGY